jgi:putative endonuclease
MGTIRNDRPAPTPSDPPTDRSTSPSRGAATDPSTDPPNRSATGTTTDQRNRARGQWGEDLAAAHYERLGCRVVDRNWRSKTGELDLVVRAGDLYVFSEVKARRNDRYGPAAAAVGIDKQRRIRQLAVEWLRANHLDHVDVRFDVVAITGTRLTLIESAF